MADADTYRAVIPYESIDPLTIGAAGRRVEGVPRHARARHPRGQPARRDLPRRARARRRRDRGGRGTRSSSPHSGPRFCELLEGATSVAIVIDNQFRPTPSVEAPARRLRRASRPPASPTPRRLRERQGLPDVRVRHRAEDRQARTSRAWSAWASRSSRTTRRTRTLYTFVGVSSRGTPVWLHKEVAKRELKITIGQAQSNHWGAGGGGKLILPGVVSDETIESNHCAFVPSPQTHYGAYARADALGHRRGRDDVRPRLHDERRCSTRTGA